MFILKENSSGNPAAADGPVKWVDQMFPYLWTYGWHWAMVLIQDFDCQEQFWFDSFVIGIILKDEISIVCRIITLSSSTAFYFNL